MYELDYVETLVKRKPQPLFIALKYILGFFTVVFFLMFMTGGALLNLGGIVGAVVFLILTAASGAGCYFANLNSNIEYEYQYCDKEITVDRIYNKSSRKRAATYELSKMEVFAPVSSSRLDAFKNRNYKEVDFGSGVIESPDSRFIMYYDGKEKVTFNPDEKLIAAVYAAAPSKTVKA